MARQEIVRRENPHSNTWRENPEVQECTHEEMYNCIQREIAEHSAIAAEKFYRRQEMEREDME